MRSSGIITLSFTGRREHSFDSAFPQFFGWLLQSVQVLGGELYQGGGSRKFLWLSVGVEILQERLLHSAVDRNAELPVYGRDTFLALRHFIGPVGATALAASVTDPRQFRSGRQFAAWLGLTPLQKSSGGKERLGRITKMGDSTCASSSLSA